MEKMPGWNVQFRCLNPFCGYILSDDEIMKAKGGDYQNFRVNYLAPARNVR
jgi:hypothetical protein